MKIYHGVPTPKKMDKIREACPSHSHGAEWLPHRLTSHPYDWILDNGGYSGKFEPEVWMDTVAAIDDVMPQDPEFVVLPDKFKDWGQTAVRSEKYASHVDYPTAVVAQPGGGVEEIVRFAVDIGAETVFVGGGQDYQLRYADRIIMTAHDYGLNVHIGGPYDLIWARDVGADSVDTTSITRNQNYKPLERLEKQTTLGVVE